MKESRVEDQVVGYHSDPNLFAQSLTLPVVEGHKLGEDSLGDGSGGEAGVGNTDLDQVDQEGGRGNRQQDQRHRCVIVGPCPQGKDDSQASDFEDGNKNKHRRD